MNARARVLLKAVSAIAVAVIAGGFVVRQLHAMRESGGAENRIWFYDQSARRLYTAARDTVPPDKSRGGPAGNAVRAIVVGFKEDEKDAQKLRIAYLETYTDEMKAVFENILAARAAQKPYTGPVPARGSEYFQTNDLVKRVEDTGWHAINSPEGQKIMVEWRDWRGPNGQRPMVNAP